MQSRLTIVILLAWGYFLSLQSGNAKPVAESPGKISRDIQVIQSMPSRARPAMGYSSSMRSQPRAGNIYIAYESSSFRSGNSNVFRPLRGEQDIPASSSSVRPFVEDGRHDTRFRPLDKGKKMIKGRRLIKKEDTPGYQSPGQMPYYPQPVNPMPGIYAPLPRW